MEDESRRRDSESGCDFVPNSSLESSLEYMEVDIDPSPNRSINNGNRSEDPSSSGNVASEESGIELESPFRRPAIPIRSHHTHSSCNDDEESTDNSDNESYGIEDVAHSTPKPKKTKPNIRIKIPLNIFKIDLDKVDTAIEKKDNRKRGQTKTNKERIDFMIDSYNPKPKKRKRGQQTNNGEGSEFNLLQSYKGHFESASKFQLLLYKKCTFCEDDETGEQMKKLHKVRYLSRHDDEAEEIFALPSGSGRSVVIQWADTNFPMSVASAILDGKSVTEKEVKNLFENRYLTRFKMKAGETLTTTPEFHLRFAPQIYTKFHATINDANAELKEILGHNKGSKVKMQVQLESISFPGGVYDINEYADVCGKLSAISSNLNLPRSREFDGYLSKVSKGRKLELDKLLYTELDKFFRLTSPQQRDDLFGKLKDFIITQKDSTKYFEASKFNIHFHNKCLKTFDECPQLQDIHGIVSRKVANVSMTDFIKIFDGLKISIPPKTGERNVKVKLFNCLEGIFYDDDAEKNYWRVGNDWYEVSSKYSFDVYIAYARVLKVSLLRKKDCHLKMLWPLKSGRKLPDHEFENKKKFKIWLENYCSERFVPEGEYNKLYNGRYSFIVTDAKVAPHGVEISDLFQYIPNPTDKSKIYLYHVKKAHGADGYRVAICQILSSAYYLHDSFKKVSSKDSPAYKLFEFIRDNRQNVKGIYEYENYKEFLDHLRNATFVFSPLFESGERDLDKDYTALIKYDFSDFEEMIEPIELREFFRKELKTFLFDNEFIYQDGEFTTKWFESCSVINDRGFHVPDKNGHYFDPFPGKQFGKLTQKRIRSILKEKYYKTVDGLSIKQLIVHMSEVLNFMGFGFKICQIEGEGDALLHNLN